MFCGCAAKEVSMSDEHPDSPLSKEGWLRFADGVVLIF